MTSTKAQQDQGRKTLAAFKNQLSNWLYVALEEPMALELISTNHINLKHIENEKSCYTFSYLLSELGLQSLSRQHITFDDFLKVPASERYTLHYFFVDGVKLLEKGLTTLQQFLAVPEKKRLSYLHHLKRTNK